MNDIALIFRKEVLNFVRSDRSVFFVYVILVAGWGMLIASTEHDGGVVASLWLVFFTVVIAANFASTVFVAERMTGSLEILLTSGVSRVAIVYGKIAFVVVMTLLIGALCGGIGVMVRPLLRPESVSFRSIGVPVSHLFLYGSAALFNASASACFSVLLPNPRLLHFINLLILGAVMAGYVALSMVVALSLHAVSALLAVAGAGFCILAQRAFESERIIKPVML